MSDAPPVSLPPPRPLDRLGAAAGLREMGASGKAWRLDRAAARGLPVPQGWVVRDEAYRRLLAQGTLREHEEGAFEFGDPELFAQRLLWRPLRARLAVRSAFGSEDDEEVSRAGEYRSVLGVEGWRARALAEALCEVWASAGVQNVRRDVLLMEMVDAQVAGVAFTAGAAERRGARHRVNWGRGLADQRVAGVEPFESMDLDADAPRPDRAPPWAQRLRALLARVEALFGADRRWDVEWADDGETCWLLQVRPVTGDLLDDDWFTVANHKEILPELPSHFMSSVMRERAGDLFRWYRRVDSGLPADRPFLELFAGRPRINVSLLCEMMERWGLPSRLVTDSMGGDGPPCAPARPLRILGRLPVLLRMAWAQGRAVARANLQMRRWREERDAAAELALGDAVDRFGRCYVELVHGMFGLTAAMAPRLSILRRMGSLAYHGQKHRTITTEMYETLAGVVQAEAGPARDAAWRRFLEAFGHRGAFESDIAEPRYRDRGDVQPATAGTPGRERGASAGADRQATRQHRSWGRRLLDLLTTPLWWQARRPMATRERFRHEAMHMFAALRGAIRRGARVAVDAGRLPAEGDVWLLSAAEVRSLESGVGVTEADLERRRALRASWAEVRLADAFRRSEAFTRTGESAAAGDRWSGMGLASGIVEGTAWVAAHPDERPPASIEGPCVLIAPAIEAGWIPAVLTADAVAVEMGGELSHGSILLREVGKPAVTAAAGVHRSLVTGDVVRVDGATGEVVRLARR